ncbi:hypothetical protein V8C37DRAFT_265151 [Trichoderma ceciliae]
MLHSSNLEAVLICSFDLPLVLVLVLLPSVVLSQHSAPCIYLLCLYTLPLAWHPDSSPVVQLSRIRSGPLWQCHGEEHKTWVSMFPQTPFHLWERGVGVCIDQRALPVPLSFFSSWLLMNHGLSARRLIHVVDPPCASVSYPKI